MKTIDERLAEIAELNQMVAGMMATAPMFAGLGEALEKSVEEINKIREEIKSR